MQFNRGEILSSGHLPGDEVLEDHSEQNRTRNSPPAVDEEDKMFKGPGIDLDDDRPANDIPDELREFTRQSFEMEMFSSNLLNSKNQTSGFSFTDSGPNDSSASFFGTGQFSSTTRSGNEMMTWTDREIKDSGGQVSEEQRRTRNSPPAVDED